MYWLNILIPLECVHLNWKYKEITAEDFFGPCSRQHSEVLQRDHHSLNVAEHSREAEAEEHDEEENRPERGKRHLDDGLCEYDEGQSSSLYTLKIFQSFPLLSLYLWDWKRDVSPSAREVIFSFLFVC